MWWSGHDLEHHHQNLPVVAVLVVVGREIDSHSHMWKMPWQSVLPISPIRYWRRKCRLARAYRRKEVHG